MKRPGNWVLGCILTSTLLAGCSTVSETVNKLNPFSSSAPKVKVAELTPFPASIDARIAWQANAGAAGDYVFTPAVVKESVFVAAADGTVTRFDGGRQIWRADAGVPLSGGVGADSELLVVGSPKGDVLAFDAVSGKEVWRARVSSEILAAPALDDTLVVVRSGDSRLFGFDRKDGTRRWVYQRSTPALSLRSDVGVLLQDKVAVAGFPGGKLVAVNTQNGAAMWEVPVALPRGATELERIADISSLPVVDRQQICAVAYQGRVACFDLANGSMLWSRDVSSSVGMDVDSSHVYVSDDKGSVLAFDRQTGASLWKQDKLANRRLTRPLVVGSQVVVADFQGFVHLLDRNDGAFAGRIATDGSPVVGELRRLGDGLLVQTSKGGVFALTKH